MGAPRCVLPGSWCENTVGILIRPGQPHVYPEPSYDVITHRLVCAAAPKRCGCGLTCDSRMDHRLGTSGRLARGPITVLHPCDRTSDASMPYRINGLAIVPLGMLPMLPRVSRYSMTF